MHSRTGVLIRPLPLNLRSIGIFIYSLQDFTQWHNPPSPACMMHATTSRVSFAAPTVPDVWPSSAEYVHTAMTAELEFLVPERMIQPDDVAEAAMLAVRTRISCVPAEVVLRNGPGSEKSLKP